MPSLPPPSNLGLNTLLIVKHYKNGQYDIISKELTINREEKDTNYDYHLAELNMLKRGPIYSPWEQREQRD